MNIAIRPSHSDVAAKMAALSHPARLEILQQLASQGCCCCKDVVERLDLAQSTVSQHLKVLVDAGLVRYAPDRQRSRYEIDRTALGALQESLVGFMQSCCPPETR